MLSTVAPITTDPSCPWNGQHSTDGVSLACPIPCDCDRDTRRAIPVIYGAGTLAVTPDGVAYRHAAYPHTDRTLYDCPACERPCGRTDSDNHAGDGACVGDHGDEGYPACPVCGDPIDYCQGHGAIAGTLPTVQIHRTAYYATEANPWDGVTEWAAVNEGTTETESWDAEWDAPDYGTPIVWAAARIRHLSVDHNLEPSAYPLPASVGERVWLAATYVNPYVSERVETAAYVLGVSDTDRAEIFRLAMLPGAEWVAVLHSHRYGS